MENLQNEIVPPANNFPTKSRRRGNKHAAIQQQQQMLQDGEGGLPVEDALQNLNISVILQ